MVYRPTSRGARTVTRPGGARRGASTSASSLSSRFSAVHEQRKEPASRAPTRRGANKPARKRNTATRMDVDEGPRGDGGSRPRGTFRSSRGRGRGRGGRGRGGRGGRTERLPVNKDKLDMDLDNYMMGDSKAGKSILDNDLDSYMQNTTA